MRVIAGRNDKREQIVTVERAWPGGRRCEEGIAMRKIGRRFEVSRNREKEGM